MKKSLSPTFLRRRIKKWKLRTNIVYGTRLVLLFQPISGVSSRPGLSQFKIRAPCWVLAWCMHKLSCLTVSTDRFPVFPVYRKMFPAWMYLKCKRKATNSILGLDVRTPQNSRFFHRIPGYFPVGRHPEILHKFSNIKSRPRIYFHTVLRACSCLWLIASSEQGIFSCDSDIQTLEFRNSQLSWFIAF